MTEFPIYCQRSEGCVWVGAGGGGGWEEHGVIKEETAIHIQ